MAYADYKHCDICDSKHFYDAQLGGNDEYLDSLEQNRIKSLCKKCAETHEITINVKPQPQKD